VSPDELNEHLRTVIVAPMTTGGRAYPWRPRCRFQGRARFVALDQLRTVDLEPLVKGLGQLEEETVLAILERLHEMFASSPFSPTSVHERPKTKENRGVPETREQDESTR